MMYVHVTDVQEMLVDDIAMTLIYWSLSVCLFLTYIQVSLESGRDVKVCWVCKPSTDQLGWMEGYMVEWRTVNGKSPRAIKESKMVGKDTSETILSGLDDGKYEVSVFATSAPGRGPHQELIFYKQKG